MASFSPNRILKYLKVSFIIFSIPFLFLVYIILNVLRKIAPKPLFNVATQKLPKFNQWKFSQKISGVEDLDFLFSYDIFEVSLYHQRPFYHDYSIAVASGERDRECPEEIYVGISSSRCPSS